jgi:hypothetical protein
MLSSCIFLCVFNFYSCFNTAIACCCTCSPKSIGAKTNEGARISVPVLSSIADIALQKGVYTVLSSITGKQSSPYCSPSKKKSPKKFSLLIQAPTSTAASYIGHIGWLILLSIADIALQKGVYTVLSSITGKQSSPYCSPLKKIIQKNSLLIQAPTSTAASYIVHIGWLILLPIADIAWLKAVDKCRLDTFRNVVQPEHV